MFGGDGGKDHRGYDAELQELERKTQQVRAQAAALEAEKQRASVLEQDRGPRRSYDGQMPLLYWMGWAIADKTRGSARLDLVRPRFAAAEPTNLFRRLIAPTEPTGTTRAGGPRFNNEWRRDDYEDPHRPRFGLGQIGGNIGQGARIKVMRHIDFGTEDQIRGRNIDTPSRNQWRVGQRRRTRNYNDVADNFQNVPDFGQAVASIGIEHEGQIGLKDHISPNIYHGDVDALKHNFKPPEKPWFDFGAGLNLELDEGSLKPSVRLKVKDFFSIKLLPEPMFKIQKRLRLGNSTMGVRVNYELPLIDAQNLWAPPARLMFRMDNHMGGLRFGPGGADFDESVLRLGKHTDVHAALGVDFPKSLPLEQGDKLFSWRARRLGVKTEW